MNAPTELRHEGSGSALEKQNDGNKNIQRGTRIRKHQKQQAQCGWNVRADPHNQQESSNGVQHGNLSIHAIIKEYFGERQLPTLLAIAQVRLEMFVELPAWPACIGSFLKVSWEKHMGKSEYVQMP
jgi:hypothetical protein